MSLLAQKANKCAILYTCSCNTGSKVNKFPFKGLDKNLHLPVVYFFRNGSSSSQRKEVFSECSNNLWNSNLPLRECDLGKVKELFSRKFRGKVAFLQSESSHQNAFTKSFKEIVLKLINSKSEIKIPIKLKKAMSSLFLPIIGSPPPMGDLVSMASSPMDDIAALTGNFEPKSNNNRRFTLRRKLSTSFDDPVSSLLLSGLVAQKAYERQGSYNSSSGGGGDSSAPIDIKSGTEGGGAWLEEHFRKINQLRISEGSEGDGDDNSVGSSGSGGGGGGFASRIQEDIFQLLEKVISFKSRNVSHITVEQCVKDLCTVYNETDDSEKLRFFNLLGEKYGVDHSSIVSLANSLASSQDEQTKLNLEEKLRAALIPKYQWLFSQVGRLDNGVKFLVDLRTDIIEAVEKSTESTTHLKPLNNCLKDLIGVWFAVGFLKLERITWNSPCEMLQKISEYEAVHPMRNWTDLKKRVGPNRRCFAFTHGSMPEEPVVVLHTALTNHIPSCIHKIVTKRRQMSLDTESDMSATDEVEDPDFIDTAIFYSITSTQRGLTGIELGNYLIKRVVKELQTEFPKMHQFSSLSPIPGFSKWLLGCLKTAQREPENQKILLPSEMETLTPIFDSVQPKSDFFGTFLNLLKLNGWYADGQIVKELEIPLMRLCAQYLYLVKRRGYAMDPVAHFHLKNGAVLWRINWLADASPRGLTNSCGMMVNYRYFLEDCEINSQTYLEEQTIKISDTVQHLVKKNDEMGSKM